MTERRNAMTRQRIHVLSFNSTYERGVEATFAALMPNTCYRRCEVEGHVYWFLVFRAPLDAPPMPNFDKGCYVVREFAYPDEAFNWIERDIAARAEAAS